MFEGCYLRVIKETSMLPKEMIVYCFVDQGHEFRVKTPVDVHGVREVILSHEMRTHFSVYV